MNNNDVMRRLRFALDWSDAELRRLAGLGGFEIAPTGLGAWLAREGDPEFEPCPDEALDAVLDGLILHRRGPRDPGGRAPDPGRLDNNLILRKLRIALELKEADMLDLLRIGGMDLSPSELAALFRGRRHPSYRPAGDQLLRHFLRGLTVKLRGVGSA